MAKEDQDENTLNADGQREYDRRRIAATNAAQKNLGRGLSDEEKETLMTEVRSPKKWTDQELSEIRPYKKGGIVRGKFGHSSMKTGGKHGHQSMKKPRGA